MPNVLILSRHAAEYQRLIEATSLPQLQLVTATTAEEARRVGADCTVVLGDPSLLRQVLPDLPRLQWAQVTWAGVESLLDPTLRHDYQLTNARGVFGSLMTEYVFGYLLAHERQILAKYQAQQTGQWAATPPGWVRGKQLGLLGVGSIGAAIAQTAKHFGLTVRGYTRTSADCPAVDQYYHGEQLLEFVTGLDYLVSVLPHTSETRQLIDARVLAALPPHAVFINVGRGSAVDEEALAEALRQNRLALAVLDVFQHEPLPPDHFFWNTPNLLITAHTAAHSFPGAIAQVFIENYGRWVRHESLLYVVDFERGY